MVVDVVMIFTIMKMRVSGKLHSSLIIHTDCCWKKEDRRRTSVLRRLPLHHRIVVMLPYVRRNERDIAGFDFAEESPHPDDLFRGLGEGDILRLGCRQGNNILFSSFPRDRTSAENDDKAASRPALVSISFPV